MQVGWLQANGLLYRWLYEAGRWAEGGVLVGSSLGWYKRGLWPRGTATRCSPRREEGGANRPLDATPTEGFKKSFKYLLHVELRLLYSRLRFTRLGCGQHNLRNR